MLHSRLDRDRYCPGGDPLPGQEEDEYADLEDVNIEFHLRSFHAESGAWCQEVRADFPFIIGEPYHFVIVRYSDGDTFGIGYGYWWIEGVYQNKEEAERVVMSIKSRKYEETHRWCPWVGYFSGFEDSYVESLVFESGICPTSEYN